MRIASFTMVGQYPHGIDLHVRNLKWALTKDDQIFIVTLPEIIKEFNLKSDGNVTYLPFYHNGDGDFINFWVGFPGLVKKYGIQPKWFQFMEEDIWFYKKPGFVPRDNREIANYLPPQTHYHAVMVGDELLQPRVWEGATLIHGDVVRRAIDYPVSFSFVKTFFHEQDREEWEREAGGKISLRFWQGADTFDEFNLYCALVEKSKICHFDRAVHLRGPETLHRKYPKLYYGCTVEDLAEPAKSLPYVDVYHAMAPYYIDGHWNGWLPWWKMKPGNQLDYERVLVTAGEWMREDEARRLREIVESFRSKDRPSTSPAPTSL